MQTCVVESSAVVQRAREGEDEDDDEDDAQHDAEADQQSAPPAAAAAAAAAAAGSRQRHVGRVRGHVTSRCDHQLLLPPRRHRRVDRCKQ